MNIQITIYKGLPQISRNLPISVCKLSFVTYEGHFTGTEFPYHLLCEVPRVWRSLFNLSAKNVVPYCLSHL